MKTCTKCGNPAPIWTDSDEGIVCMTCAQKMVRQALQKIRADMDEKLRSEGENPPVRLYCDECNLPIENPRQRCPHCGYGGLG